MEQESEFSLLIFPFQGHAATITKLAFNPQKNELISGSLDGTVRVWDAKNKELKYVITEHFDQISNIIVLKNGLFLTAGWDKQIVLWDTVQMKKIKKITGLKGEIYDVAVSPDENKLLVSYHGRQAKLFDLKSEERPITIRGHKDEISVVAFSPNNKYFATGSWDKTVKIWDAKSNRPIQTIQLGNEVSALYFSNNDKLLIGDWGGTLTIYDLAKNEIIRQLAIHHNIISQILLDEKRDLIITASADKTLKVYSMNELEEKYVLEEHSSRIFSIAQNNDFLFSAGADKKIIIWDKNVWKKIDEIKGREHNIFQTFLTPTGEYAQILDSSGKETFVDLKTLNQIEEKPNVPFFSKEKLSSLKPIILGHDGVAVIFNLNTLNEEQTKLLYVAVKNLLEKESWIELEKNLFANISTFPPETKEKIKEKIKTILALLEKKLS